MTPGSAIAILLAVDLCACLAAAYLFCRYASVHAALIKSDDLASARGVRIQEQQMQIEAMKERRR